MDGWWASHAAVRWLTAVALAACAVYCLARLISTNRLAAGSLRSSWRTADTGHAVMLAAMAVIFLPLGDHLPTGLWVAVFGASAVGFVIVAVRLAPRRRSPRSSSAASATAGYHTLCALAMVYMFVCMSGTTFHGLLTMSQTMDMSGPQMSGMRMSGVGVADRGMHLGLPGLGWALTIVFIVDAVAVFNLVTLTGRAPWTVSSPADDAVANPAEPDALAGTLFTSERVSSVPHVAMDLSMAAMMLVMLLTAR